MKSVLSLFSAAAFLIGKSQSIMLQGIESEGEWTTLAQTYVAADAVRSQCLVMIDSNYKASIFYPVIGNPLAQQRLQFQVADVGRCTGADANLGLYVVFSTPKGPNQTTVFT